MGALHATGRGVLAKLTARSALSVLVLGLALLAGTAIGETRIPFDTVLSALANRIFGANYPIDKIDEGIIWAYRLPRAVPPLAAGRRWRFRAWCCKAFCATRWQSHI